MTDNKILDAETSETTAPADTDESTAAAAETAGTTETETEETTMTGTTVTGETSPAATAEALLDVETLGKDLPGWKLAGVMRHQRWAPGKAVTRAAFGRAVAAFEGRPLGGGR